MANIYPDINIDNISEQNLQIQTFGRRIFNSQTVPEYFLEFLQVFLGEKNKEDKRIGFSKIDDLENVQVKYIKNPNIGLKRFILYDNTKLDSRFNVDTEAYEKINNLLKKKIETNNYSEEELLNIIRDLFNGFTMVKGNRGWFAQTVMPICREVVFCEAIGAKASRKEISMMIDENFNIDTEKKFEFKRYNFLARGGEVYYLHLLQGFNYIKKNRNEKEAKQIMKKMEDLLLKLVDSYSEFSNLSNWILSNWFNYIIEQSNEYHCKDQFVENLKITGECQWIVNEYERRSYFSVMEIINVLKSDINEVDKTNLISKGIVLQIIRMMSEAAYIQARNDSDGGNRAWMIHFNSNRESDNKVKKLAIECYKQIEEDSMIALAEKLGGVDNNNVVEEDGKPKGKSEIQLLKDGYDNSYKLMRKLGKDIGIIIPIKGDNMRLTLSDEIVRFLVVALVPPAGKMTINTFLDKLYKNYGIIIGSKEYNKNQLRVKGQYREVSFLKHNLEEFQVVLKMNGFLKELSDATSIVVNPYNEIKEVE